MLQSFSAMGHLKQLLHLSLQLASWVLLVHFPALEPHLQDACPVCTARAWMYTTMSMFCSPGESGRRPSPSTTRIRSCSICSPSSGPFVMMCGP
uniref:Glycosyltransferase N-terminal domain-containing protein n=1 Tax=Arundo donax TaxID=35708 RepID=A0A0A9CJ79_ARUDO